VTIASNDDFTKQIAPVVAPHMVNIDLLLNQLHRLESAVVGTSQQSGATNGPGMRVEESVSLLQGLFQQGMKMMMVVGKENNNNDDDGKTSHLHNNNSSSSSSNNNRHGSNNNSGGSHTKYYDPRVEELPLDESDDPVYSTAAAAASMDTSTNGLRFRQKPSDNAR